MAFIARGTLTYGKGKRLIDVSLSNICSVGRSRESGISVRWQVITTRAGRDAPWGRCLVPSEAPASAVCHSWMSTVIVFVSFLIIRLLRVWGAFFLQIGSCPNPKPSIIGTEKALCQELESWSVQEIIHLPSRNEVCQSRTELWFHPFPRWGDGGGGTASASLLPSAWPKGSTASATPPSAAPATAPSGPAAAESLQQMSSLFGHFGRCLTHSSSPAGWTQRVLDSCLVLETICCSDWWLKELPRPPSCRRANRFQY